jgi:carboxymethylenebutenolidase
MATRRHLLWLLVLAAILVPSFSALAQDADPDTGDQVASGEATADTTVGLPTTTPEATATATPEPAVRPPDPAAREQFVQFPSGEQTLGGFIWKPPGDGPFPAVLYNHGSEQLPGWKPDLGQLFVGNGYVFFIPHRRGQGRSPGPYISDQIQQAPPSERNRLQVELLEAQVADQLAGLQYLRSLPFVDTSRLAVAGCSYGGIQTLLGAEANPGYRAAVDFAGGAQSWAGNPLLQQRLTGAVQRITVPTFFLQAENDYDLQPSRVLSAEMDRLGKANAMRIYPPYGMTRDEGHGGFCEYGGRVWGADVFAFLRQWLG